MKKMRRGFTLVELALSMAFIGILSVAVVLIISNTVAAYRRGMTLSRVNTTGLDLVDDMRLAVGNSSSRAVSTDCYRFYKDASEGGNLTGALADCVNDGAYSFVTITKYADVIIDKGDYNEKLEHVPIYGAFCTGTYSYIWNSGYFEMEEATIDGVDNKSEGWAKFQYKAANNKKTIISHTTRGTDDESKNRPFRLLKIRDDYRSVCASVSLPNPTSKTKSYKNTSTIENDIKEGRILSNNTFSILNYRALSEAPEDLILADSDNDLALFDLYVAEPAESTTQKNMFYSVSFILGTVNGGADITANGNSCVPPTNYEAENFDYCAINKFSFAMQANGEL